MLRGYLHFYTLAIRKEKLVFVLNTYDLTNKLCVEYNHIRQINNTAIHFDLTQTTREFNKRTLQFCIFLDH